jgi:predicted dehydrogenase/threonine dehydrogenase-like Zn-dependent dehydrogenase
MIQAILRKGRVVGEELPLPVVSDGSALIKVMYSCISSGTEMSTVQASETSLIRKAWEQPEQVKKVLEMVHGEGISRTFQRIKERRDAGTPMGYSLSGVVVATGRDLTEVKVGDRVACGGAGIAHHAEYVDVPKNLMLRIPDALGFKEASTVALGAIAMQGVRRADLRLGEYVVVFGLGVIGQLVLQMAHSAGCRVIGIDLEEQRLGIGKENGADWVLHSRESNIVKEVIHFSDGYGADKVIFTAATASSEPLHLAFQMTRKKGRVVLVGVSGMEIKREDLYPKELDFLISTSYGPGRYDEAYESRGIDYPYAYVRWTENRNMQEYLKEVAEGRIRLRNLMEGIYPIEKVEEAFEALQRPDRPLMVLLEYDQHVPEDLQALYEKESRMVVSPTIGKKEGVIHVGIVGAGGFATSVHLPNLEKLRNQFKIHAIASKTPHHAKAMAQQYHAHYATCQVDDILNDESVDLVMILTRHHLHGDYVLKSLMAGKNVFVEKPLSIKQEELDRIKDFYTSRPATRDSRQPLLMVGFNRRFSKYAEEAKRHTKIRMNPLFMHYRVNAGYIPLDHWVHGPEGGGRIIGEVCHFIDLFTFFTECKVKEIYTSTLIPKTQSWSADDNRVMVFNYEDGSIATLEYFATGSKEFPKEYLEIHFDEKTIVIDDYQGIRGYGINIHEIRGKGSDKGHLRELEVLSEVLQGKREQWPIELWDLFQTTEMTFAIDQGNCSCAE